jgi:hypothetical protein
MRDVTNDVSHAGKEKENVNNEQRLKWSGYLRSLRTGTRGIA